jgi:hypothetical protein
MTFLNPAILFGLFAASIPILLHFLNLRKLKKVEFSTLSFLKELQKTKIRRIKLKQWLLLLLRVSIIVFLVLAFARPTIKNSTFGTSTTKTTAVFIIDNTFSMSIVSNGGSYFNRIKQISKDVIDNFEPGDEIAVIPTASVSKNDISIQSNFIVVKREIEGIQISNIRKTIHESIIKAGQILYNSKNYNKEVYLFTDLQSGSIYDAEAELSKIPQLFSGARIFIVDINRKSALNIGVSNFILNNQVFEKNKQIGFRATITNYSEHNIVNSIASLFINDRRSAQQSVSLGPKESEVLFFETTLTDTGIVNAFVELEDDDNNYDNKTYLSFYVPDKIKLLLASEISEDSRFVRLALNQTSNLVQLTESNSSQLPVYSLSNYDAVVIIGTTNENGIGRLKNFLENGGRVLFFPSSVSDIGAVQNLFGKLNLPLPERYIGKASSNKSVTQFEKANFNHPIFSNLFEEKSKGEIESPDIYQYLKINSGGQGTNIISMFDKSAFLSEYKVGKGKLLAFNTSPVLSWGNFPVKSIFPTIINKSISYLSSNIEDGGSNLAGNELFINIESASGGQLKVVSPDNLIEYVNIDPSIYSNYFRYVNTDKIGTYKFYSGEKLLNYFPVNQDPRGSIVDYHSVLDFKDYLEKIGFEGFAITVEENQNFSNQIYNARFGTELWKYFVIAALLFALLEMIVARISKKDTEQINS